MSSSSSASAAEKPKSAAGQGSCKHRMPPMNLFKDIFCQVTLGIIVGAPLLIVFGLPALLYLAYRGSFVAGTLLVPLVYLTLAPLPKPNDAMFTSFVFRWWCEYFDLTVDVEYVTEEMKNDADTRFLIFDFPHGIFPFGSLLALHYWKMIFPNRKGGGVAADIVFKIPFVRQLMSLLRMLPAKRKNITKLLDAGVVVGVIPGGIAEMFLGSGDREQFYFRKRRNTVKMAIQEGATILPFLFFGHSRCFKLVGKGGDSWLMRLSRKMRASIVFFYGRHFLPIPLRVPIHCVMCTPVACQRCAEPTDAMIDEYMQRVIASTESTYEKKKPSWETRPLEIL